jgi:hypothetical protein
VTDAGTPGIADPGYSLLQALVQQAIPIVHSRSDGRHGGTFHCRTSHGALCL